MNAGHVRRVVVITGPIASGKSTVAREVARELTGRGVRTAVIDLDLVYDMLADGGSKSDEATWALARHGAAALTNTFLDEGVAVVIAEGSFNTQADRTTYARHLEPPSDPLYVSLRVSYEEALRRAQGDPSRGVSRDPNFLGPYFAARADLFAAGPSTDLVIDTERATATEAAKSIARTLPASGSGPR